jgi:hypothetical protein
MAGINRPVGIHETHDVGSGSKQAAVTGRSKPGTAPNTTVAPRNFGDRGRVICGAVVNHVARIPAVMAANTHGNASASFNVGKITSTVLRCFVGGGLQLSAVGRGGMFSFGQPD